MFEPDKKQHKRLKIGFLGASLGNPNLGVEALSEASIKCMLHQWPDAQVVLLGGAREEQMHALTVQGRQMHLAEVPIRFCRNIFIPNHFVVFAFYALLLRLLPWKRLRNLICRRNPYFRKISETDMVVDITGGDSFSDIYGMRRYTLDFLRKWLVLKLNKKLIMLPQTYGPFRRPLARMMAKYVLKRASVICARDEKSSEAVKDIFGDNEVACQIQTVPDVAFVLDAREPENLDLGNLPEARTAETLVVGLNVSGLLYNGGYTRDNMFALKVNYKNLARALVESLLKNPRAIVLLVPHVFAPAGNVEDDVDACSKIYQNLGPKYPGRIFLARGTYNQNEIKYIIGKCDFFIGSRMHACIAALSQGIPAVGIAYSRKFHGVFQSVGMEHFVIDLHNNGLTDTLKAIDDMLERRTAAAQHLHSTMPEIQDRVINLFQRASC